MFYFQAVDFQTLHSHKINKMKNTNTITIITTNTPKNTLDTYFAPLQTLSGDDCSMLGRKSKPLLTHTERIIPHSICLPTHTYKRDNRIRPRNKNKKRTTTFPWNPRAIINEHKSVRNVGRNQRYVCDCD